MSNMPGPTVLNIAVIVHSPSTYTTFVTAYCAPRDANPMGPQARVYRHLRWRQARLGLRLGLGLGVRLGLIRGVENYFRWSQ